MEEKPKILKVFYESGVQESLPQFKIIFAPVKLSPNFGKIKNYTAEDFDSNYMNEVLSATKKLFEEHLDIKGVFIKLDIEALIISAIAGELYLPHLKIPTFESVFLCNHKFYQRMIESDPIKFTYFDIYEENWSDNIPNFPFYIKPANQQRSIHQYIVRSRDQLNEIIELLMKDLPKCESYYIHINKKYIDLNKYPLAERYIMICEEFIENKEQLNYEGWADENGNIHTYGFTDELLTDQGIFSDFVMPTKFPVKILKKAENICVNLLKSCGFTNGFFNVELWIGKEGDIKIIEVNPRICYSYSLQYKAAYETDLLNAAISLSMGTPVSNIPLHTKFYMYATQSIFATRMNGKINEILDLNKIKEEQQLHTDYTFVFLFDDPEFEIVDNVQNGARVLLRVYFNKDSYNEIVEESNRLKKIFLPKDKLA